MRTLPPILFRDYLRHVIWPHVQLFSCCLAFGAIIIGLIV